MEIKQMKRYSSLLMLVWVALFAVLVIKNIVSVRKDFYNELWGPAHFLVNRQNPYDTASLKPDLPAVWLPMAISLYSPLGLLDASTAAYVWFLFNALSLCVIVWLVVKDEKSLWVALVAGLFAYFFPPVIKHFVLGQFSIIVLLCLLLAAKSAELTRLACCILSCIGADQTAAWILRCNWTRNILF